MRYNTREVESLCNIFRERNAGRGPNVDYGLLHGGLVLLVSGWETYCEDVSIEAVEKICNHAAVNFEDLPDKVKRSTLKYAWPSNIENVDPLATDLARLPGAGWKAIIRDKVKNYLIDFNTPKFRRGRGKDLKGLFGLYLANNISTDLDQLSNIANLSNEVDRIITLRGAIAHKGKPNDEDRFYADELMGYLDKITKACAAIDCIIHKEYRELYGRAPWQMTDRVTEHLPGLR